MIPVVTLFVVCAGAVEVTTSSCSLLLIYHYSFLWVTVHLGAEIGTQVNSVWAVPPWVGIVSTVPAKARE